jgi:hypothetical protein
MINRYASNSLTARIKGRNDYTTFGSIMEGRSYEGDTSLKYRFGFNTQEIDDEVYGKGNVTAAEFWEYDSRLGRRWNMDIILKLNESPFATFSNNPVVFIDILGNTDFINTDGVWIGTDGDATKNITVVVTDYTLAKKIAKQSAKGNDYTTPIPNDKFYELPAKVVLEAAVAVLDESLKTTPEDPDGGRHEVVQWFDNKMEPSEMIIGKDVLKEGSLWIRGADVPEGVEGKVLIHSHLTSFIVNQNGSVTSADASEPSRGPDMDTEAFKDFEVNIIVGKNGSPTLVEGSSRIQGNTRIQEPSKWEDHRTLVMNFFDRASNLKATLSISAIKTVIAGDTKKNNKTYKKYEAAKKKAIPAPAPTKD